MPRNFVYFDNFNQGESGLHGDWLTGFRLFRGILIYTGTWHGSNVMRYIDGTLGPRPGLLPTTITGLPTGKVLGFTGTPVPGVTGVVLIGTTVYLVDLIVGGAAINAGTITSAPTTPAAFVMSGSRYCYMTVPGDKTYQIDLFNHTTTAMANSPGGTCITIYNNRLVVGNPSATNLNRIIFSEPVAPGAAAPNQFVFDVAPIFYDVADPWQITGLFPQRNHLTITKQNAIYVYTGEPNVNASIRKALDTDGPLYPRHAVLSRAGLLWYVPIFRDLPIAFNGSAITPVDNLRFANGVYTDANSDLPAVFGVSNSLGAHDVWYFSGAANGAGANRGLFFSNGAWSYHDFGVPVSGFLASLVLQGVYVCDGGGVGVTAKFFYQPTELNRPVKAGDNATPQDGVANTQSAVANTNWVEFPEWESRDGSEVVIRAVHVSFKKWNTGMLESNHLECALTATRQFRKAGVAGPFSAAYGQPSQVQSWDEAPGMTVSDGQYQHVVFRFGDQMTGNGFKLMFKNLRGVSLQKIQVILDIEPTRD